MLLGLIFLSLLHLSIACSSDNCVRALKRHNAADFCSTYTTGISTVTASLPAYVTACSNSPSRISSACSCLTTAPVTTCVPSTLKDPSFQFGSADWTVTVNLNPTQTVAPEYGIQGDRFEVDFPNFQPDPFLATVTLFQSSLNICNGLNTVGFQYVSTINAIAPTFVPEESNCTITSGFDGIQSSVLITDVPWVTPSGTIADVNYDFSISGLADTGTTTAFYLTIQCPLADWWPEVQILNPSVN